MSITALSAALLLLQGCPQSPTDPGGGEASSDAASAASADAAKGEPDAEVGAADAEGPSAGNVEGPPPSETPGPPPGDVSFDLDGEVVQLSGSVSYDGDKTGEIRLDFLTLDENRPPQLVNTAALDAPGDFSIEATANFGEVYVVGFVDQSSDGPSPSDPAGMVQLEIGDADITGITLTLADDPELGPLTPGEGVKDEAMEIPEEVPPPPSDEGADPSEGAEPPGGAEGVEGAEGAEPPGGAEGAETPE